MRIMRTFGAPGFRWFTRGGNGLYVDSCSVGPATLGDGTGGNGNTEPSVGVCAIVAIGASAQNTANSDVLILMPYLVLSCPQECTIYCRGLDCHLRISTVVAKLRCYARKDLP